LQGLAHQQVTHPVHEKIEVAAGHGAAFPLAKGKAVRLINTHGTQVVDCWAWNAADLSEHMSMEASRVYSQRLRPKVGDSFVTTRRKPILTVVEDTSPGIHDTFMAACDRHRYELLGLKSYHRNCLDNMMEAMRAIGKEPPLPILASFNIFMNIAVEPDGQSLSTRPAVSKPGDSITLRAEMDCIVAVSACPQDIVKIQGADNVPKPFHYSVLDDGFPDLPVLKPWVPTGAAI
jgi:uncharacterized protein YcgI (DUF1989 family)